VAAIVGTEMRGVSPGEVASSLKLLVDRAEKVLRIVNKVSESWPVDSLAVWAPDRLSVLDFDLCTLRDPCNIETLQGSGSGLISVTRGDYQK
jgi:hypothetical protein